MMKTLVISILIRRILDTLKQTPSFVERLILSCFWQMDETGGGGPDSLYPGKLLHQAALWANAELLEDLLHGDEIRELNTPDSSGRTALFDACTNADPACARILLQAGGQLLHHL